MHRVVAVLALAGLCGCYVYLPLGAVEPHVGSRVAAELTGDGSDSLARVVGPGIATVRGDVIGTESTAVTLSVASATDLLGRDQSWKGEPVRLPRGAVRSLEQRKFSPGRSLLLGAVLVGSSVIAWQAFQGGIRGGSLMPGGVGGGTK